VSRPHERSTRERLLSTLAPSLREQLRRGRDHLQHLQSRIRARLPVRWGGRFPLQALHSRRLGLNDSALLSSLRAPSLQSMAADDSGRTLDDPRQFCVGVFAAGQLVGAGWCIALSEPPNAYQNVLFAADYVRPECRGRGVARALHAARLSELAPFRPRGIFAWVERSNRAARASLLASGFACMSDATIPRWLERPSSTHSLLAYPP
jgi:hypothetical protein